MLDAEQKSHYNLTVDATDGTRSVSTQVIELLMKCLWKQSIVRSPKRLGLLFWDHYEGQKMAQTFLCMYIWLVVRKRKATQAFPGFPNWVSSFDCTGTVGPKGLFCISSHQPSVLKGAQHLAVDVDVDVDVDRSSESTKIKLNLTFKCMFCSDFRGIFIGIGKLGIFMFCTGSVRARS